MGKGRVSVVVDICSVVLKHILLNSRVARSVNSVVQSIINGHDNSYEGILLFVLLNLLCF